MTTESISRINCQTCGSLQPEMSVEEAEARFPNPFVTWICTHSSRCATCGTFAKGNKGRRIIRVKASTKVCDDSCLYARGDTCACNCGGKNHGMGRPL